MIFKRTMKGLLDGESLCSTYQAAAGSSALSTRPSPSPRPQTASHLSGGVEKNNYSVENSMNSYPQEDFPYAAASVAPTEPALEEVLQPEEEEPETTVGEGVSFKGQLTFKRYLAIHGQFEGELISRGKLRVGKTGRVKSNLHLHSAVIEGQVEGDIVVEELLELRGSAQVSGNITARYLRVDDGVTLVGLVRIHPEGYFHQSSESSFAPEARSYDSQEAVEGAADH